MNVLIILGRGGGGVAVQKLIYDCLSWASAVKKSTVKVKENNKKSVKEKEK
jgi:hypothetical protein